MKKATHSTSAKQKLKMSDLVPHVAPYVLLILTVLLDFVLIWSGKPGLKDELLALAGLVGGSASIGHVANDVISNVGKIVTGKNSASSTDSNSLDT